MTTSKLIVSALFAFATAWISVELGNSYISRLPDHRGFFLVPVDDEVGKPLAQRPRHTALVLFDGLRLDLADRMKSMKEIEARGRCAVTDVGPVTVSRPVYAVLSTGLEQDRTGSRNNDQKSPLAAESFWQVARKKGFEVTATSGVPWWQQLFPDGFASYRVAEEEEDFFTTTDLRDLTLIHPDYVDHAGHSHGAASPEYAKAAERGDRELAGLLAKLDLEQDLIIVTSDHGHSATGGHGGPGPEIREVLTCLAGRGVAKGTGRKPMTMRSLGPAIALLLGLPFPRHMRAGEDELDDIFEITTGMNPDYLADRRQAVARFRRENEQQVGKWSEHYAIERKLQWARALPFLVLAAAIILKQRSARTALWVLIVSAATYPAHIYVRGSFDFTALNQRADYVRSGFIMCIAIAAVAALGHVIRFRDMAKLLEDELILTGVSLVVMVGHIYVFGWPVGFPLPGAALFVLPFIAAIFTAVHATLAGLLSLGLFFAEFAKRPKPQ